MRLLAGGDFLPDFFFVFFREGLVPSGALIFLLPLPLTELRLLDREEDAGAGEGSSSSRKTVMSGHPGTAVGGCSDVGSGLFVGSALAGGLLPGAFMGASL